MFGTPPPNNRVFVQLQRRVQQQDLVIVKADKGETLIILSRTNYEEKMLDFLNRSGAKPSNFNLANYNKEIRAAIKCSTLVIRNQGKDLLQMCVATPRLYGQIKLHKKDHPIRPVVAYFSDPAFHLSKYLAKWFRTLAAFDPQHTVKNSIELAKDLKKKSFPPTSRLLSFDAVSMFTKIPVLYTIDIMISHLQNQNIHPNVIAEFKNLITLCLKDNICFYRGKTYRFPDGLPMGGPLSSLVADVYMDNLETKILSDDNGAAHVLYYKRYVDDILCIWDGPDVALQQFLDSMNNHHPSVTFTLEMGNHTLGFLDLRLQLTPAEAGLSVEFSIYRKTTFSGISISNDSLHPRPHKMAQINAAIHRLLHLPLTEEAHKTETLVIEHMARRNGLNVNVPKMIRRKRLRMLLAEPDAGNNPPQTVRPRPPPPPRNDGYGSRISGRLLTNWPENSGNTDTKQGSTP